MPQLKMISGHGSCAGVARYLSRGGRALAADFVNCCEVDAAGREAWRQMDDLRAAAGNDAPHGGRPARTYEHVIVSPDPRDRVCLAQLQELCVAWAERHFGDYQVAIWYHDDNEAGIPHAHLVVNNTSLADGSRLAPALTSARLREMRADLQDMAHERGMRAFDHEAPAAEGRPARDAPPQRAYRKKPEREIVAQGRFSWKEDVRARVDSARLMSRTVPEFLEACSLMGLAVRESGRGREWVYTHPARDTWAVRGKTLGLAWSRRAVEGDLALARAGRSARPPEGRLAAIRECVSELSRDGLAAPQVLGTARGTEVTAAQVASMLAVVAREDASCMADLADAARSRRGAAREDALSALRTARALGCLPEERGERDGRRDPQRSQGGAPRSQAKGGAPQPVAAPAPARPAERGERGEQR